ncbi:MAG: SpoIIE family protein phosphatase [Bacteroidetes bacterium]|nr:SpoIIE family protein phosphatase [Bacteroidota bacterium]
MSISKKTKTALYFSIGFFLFFSLLAVLKNMFQSTEPDNKAFKVTSIQYIKKSNPFTEWKYSPYDSTQYALPAYNDALWKNTNPELNPDSVPHALFDKVLWFRCFFKIPDSLTKKVLAINIKHYGASEIYLDGKLQRKFGKIAPQKKDGYAFIPDMPIIFALADTLPHVLAIRYFNNRAVEYRNKYEEFVGGFTAELYHNPYKAIKENSLSGTMSFISLCLFGFLFTLGLIHFLLYLFYRKQKENAYFAVFMFCFSSVMIKPFAFSVITNPFLNLFYTYHSLVFPMLALVSLIACMQILFTPPYLKVVFVIACILGLFTWFTDHISALSTLDFSAWFILVIFTCVECMRAIIVGFRRKQEGVKIIGIGVIVFLVVIISYFSIIAILSDGDIDVAVNGFKGVVILLVLLIAITSVPLSMSIYLARNFARTNIHLQSKLEEVEQLSEKSLQQEKEKQHILSVQNEMLEQKVTERTAEVVQQKTLLEIKNKEITDSITYAKRIQNAILPNPKKWQTLLPHSFVLYQPKDIVAGDFYWLEETAQYLYIAAADCTGHGVPGAMVSVVCSSALSKAVLEEKQTETHAILDATRRLVLEQLGKSEEKIRDGMDICLIRINKNNRKHIQYSGANRPLYISNAQGELQELKPDKQPIGQYENEKPFTQQELVLNENDTLYLLTDGYADQFGGDNNKKFSSKALKKLMTENAHKTIEEQRLIFTQAFFSWRSNIEQTDDVTLLGVRV